MKPGIQNRLFLFPLLLVVYEITTYLTNDAYLPALPQIANDLAITPYLAQLTVAAWSAGSASTQLIAGTIADRIGRRPVLFTGGIVFLFSTFICSLAPNIIILMLGRILQGASIPAMVVPAYCVIHELLDEQEAILTLAWMNSITILAPAMGPLFGAIILIFSSWRGIFIILALLNLSALIGLFKYMPETLDRSASNKIEIRNIVKDYKQILFNKKFALYSASEGFLFAALVAWIVAGPLLVIHQYHYPPVYFGFFQILVFGSYIISTRLIKPLTRIINIQRIASSGLYLALFGGIFALIGAVLNLHALWYLLIALVWIAIGAGLCSPIYSRLAIQACQEPMGARMAIFSSLMAGFAVLASLLISFFTKHSYTALLYFLAFTSILAFSCGKLTKSL